MTEIKTGDMVVHVVGGRPVEVLGVEYRPALDDAERIVPYLEVKIDGKRALLPASDFTPADSQPGPG